MTQRMDIQLITIKVLLFFILILPPYVTIKNSSFPGISPERIIEFYLFFSWVLFFLYSQKFRERNFTYIYQYWLIILFILTMYYITMVSSLFFSINILSSLGNIFITFFGQGFLLVAILGFVDTRHVKKLIQYILLIEVLIIAISFIEFILQQPLFSTLTFLNENSNPAFTEGNYRNGLYRIISTMPHSLVLAQLLLILLPFNHYFLKNSEKKIFYIFNIMATPIVIILTDSRMGIAVYGFFYFLYCLTSIIKSFTTITLQNFLRGFLFKFTIFFSIIIGLFVYNSFEYLVQTIPDIILENSSERTASTNSSLARITQLVIASENISWIGYGAHGTEAIMKNYNLPVMDNYYISLLLKSGIIGLSIYILMLLIIFKLIVNYINLDPIITSFFYFYLNYSIFILILSIDYLMNLFYIFLGFLLILLTHNKNYIMKDVSNS